ncbi:MAG TPA: acyl-ACP desaturase [Bacilli bacterium]|nr:acyl-ACP desaturase [Bacilli bacterium]
MLLPQLDPRLEQRLMQLYKEHCERAANIDWSYHEFIPWEQGQSFKTNPWSPEQRKLPPAIYTAIETALLTEVNLPWFTVYLSSTFVGSLDVMQEFIHTWVAEEDQHSNLLETYLLITRNANPHELHHLRKTVVEQGFVQTFTTPFEAMCYASLQELATLVFYNNVAKAAAPYDRELSLLLRRLAKDESLHYAFYRDAVKAHLELEPNYVYHAAHVLKNFYMPGSNMPDYQERMKAIAREANYGPAQFYQQVTRVLVEYWGIADLRPTSAEAELARLELLKHNARLERVAARFAI